MDNPQVQLEDLGTPPHGMMPTPSTMPDPESISFHNERGEIVGSLSGPKATIDVTKQHTDDLWVNGTHDGAVSYVQDGAVRARPEQNTTLDGHTLMHLPVPCIIHINETAYDCDDDTAELVLDQNTTYAVVVEAWPFLDREYTIENNP